MQPGEIRQGSRTASAAHGFGSHFLADATG